MKKTLHLVICSLLVCMVLGIISCNKTCQQGYENPNCSVEIRAHFENLYYTVTESKNGDSAYSYPATIISTESSILKLQLTNIANNFFVHNVIATVNYDTLTIPYQNPDSNASYIQGRGILSNNVLTLTYTIVYSDSLPVLHTQTDLYQSVWVHP